MYFPKYLWFKSQLYSLQELRKKSAADNKKKGVVGKRGKTIPIMPRPREISPKKSSNNFKSLFCE